MTKIILLTIGIVNLCLSEIMIAQEILSPAPKSTPRIVGGEIADSNAWPWMAILVMHGKSPLEGQFCGGTLIHPQWVLTAAHCVEDIFFSKNIDVLFGVHNLRTDEGERVSVKKIVIHPDYHIPDSDLALLKLEKPVNYPPVSLINSDKSLEGKMATTLGWGDTSDVNNRPIFLDELRQVELPILSNIECNKVNSWVKITPNMLCAGFIEGGKDSCQGDSGGPLVIMNESGDGWTQVGIISFGDGCAQADSYGVYTRVSVFGNFIAEQLKGGTQNSTFNPVSGGLYIPTVEVPNPFGIGINCYQVNLNLISNGIFSIDDAVPTNCN